MEPIAQAHPVQGTVLSRSLHGRRKGRSIRHALKFLMHATVLEDDEGRDAANPILAGDGWFLVHVQLHHPAATLHGLGDLFQNGGLRLAGATPRRPEIHQHHPLGDFLLEVRLAEGDRIRTSSHKTRHGKNHGSRKKIHLLKKKVKQLKKVMIQLECILGKWEALNFYLEKARLQ